MIQLDPVQLFDRVFDLAARDLGQQIRERQRMAEMVQQVRAVLTPYVGAVTADPTAVDPTGGDDTLRRRILRLFAQERRELTVDDIQQALAQTGVAVKRGTLTSRLSRMYHRGFLMRTGESRYALAPMAEGAHRRADTSV